MKSGYRPLMQEELDKLAKNGNARQQWFDFWYENEPVIASAIDYGRAFNLGEAEQLKLVICALMGSQGDRKL